MLEEEDEDGGAYVTRMPSISPNDLSDGFIAGYIAVFILVLPPHQNHPRLVLPR
jgi:hypothetical protein